MTVYLVTWDLNREKPNYAQKRAAFVQQVEAYDHIKDGGLDSVRFISTTNSPQQVTTTFGSGWTTMIGSS